MKYITKACKLCGIQFDAAWKQIFANGKPNGWRCRTDYCSDVCKRAALSAAAKTAVHQKADRSPNTQCATCGTAIYRAPRYLKLPRSFCSDACQVAAKAIDMQGNKHGVGIKQTPERVAHRASFIRGSNNPAWRGGITFHKGRGKKPYKYVKCPADLSSMSNKHGYIAEHRLVMARLHGRPLTAYEVVHHINHDTLDNREENLMLFSSNAEHKLYEGRSGVFKRHHIHTNRPKP